MVCSSERARKLEQRQHDQAITAQLALPRPNGPSLTHCQDCDAPIPKKRQTQGAMTRCTPCQALFKQGQRR